MLRIRGKKCRSAHTDFKIQGLAWGKVRSRDRPKRDLAKNSEMVSIDARVHSIWSHIDNGYVFSRVEPFWQDFM